MSFARVFIIGLVLGAGAIAAIEPAAAQPSEFSSKAAACLATAPTGAVAADGRTVDDAVSLAEFLVGAACVGPSATTKEEASTLLTKTLDAVTADIATHCAQSATSGRCVALKAVEERALALRSQSTISRGAGYFLLNGAVVTGYAGVGGVDFAARLNEQAPSPREPSTLCKACYQDAIDLAPVIMYAKAVGAIYLAGPAKDGLALVNKDLTARLARWDAYHFGGGDKRVQLPWELLLNGYLYSQSSLSKTNTPPDGAFVLLHPSVGLSLKDKKGADSNVVGVVELFGYSTWGYTKENKRGDEWGGSVIAAYQPSDTAEDWGYGVLVRTPWNNINVAWVRTELDAGGSDDAFLISVDLTSLLPKSVGDALGFKKQDGE